MKKLLLIFAGIFVVFVVAIISIPFFVDVDKYRPEIIKAVNQNIKGELKLGKLNLSLIGGIKVKAEEIELKVNGFTKPMVGTNQFYIEIPFMSLLTGPKVIAVLKEPSIFIEKNVAGKMNAMELVGNNPETNAAPADKSNPPQVPAFLAAASFGLRIEKGNLNYEDAIGKAKYAVKGLELSLKDLGLLSTTSLKLEAPLQGSSPTFSFGGVIKASGTLKPILAGGAIKSASGQIDIDAGNFAFTVLPDLVTKTDKMPMSAKLSFEGSDKDMLIKTLELKFFEFAITGKGLLSTQGEPNLRLELASNEIGLEKFQDLIPMLKAYALKGKMGLNTKLDLSAAKIGANGELKLSDGEFSMANVLKAPLGLNLKAGFTENSLNILKAELSGPESDLQFTGTVRDFMAPQFNLAINGKSWNVDKTIVLPNPAAAPAKQAFYIIPSAYAAVAPTGVNPMLEFAKNPLFLRAAGNVTGNLGSLVVYGAKLEAINLKAQLSSFVLKLTQASFKTFGGSVNSTGEFDLKSPALLYKSSGKLAGVSAKDAVASYFPKFKNTLEGITDGDWNLSGSLYPESIRMKSLKGFVKVQAKNGNLKTVDFKDSIQGIMAKVPFLKNSKAPDIEEGFKVFKADLNFADGNTKVEPIYYLGQGKGLEVKGKSFIKESFEQETFFDVFDPNGLLPKELHSSGKPALAMRVTGMLTGPQVDYEYTVKKLAGTAGKNVVQQQIGKLLGGNKEQGDNGGNKAQEAVKSIGDALKKKFKF